LYAVYDTACLSVHSTYTFCQRPSWLPYAHLRSQPRYSKDLYCNVTCLTSKNSTSKYNLYFSLTFVSLSFSFLFFVTSSLYDQTQLRHPRLVSSQPTLIASSSIMLRLTFSHSLEHTGWAALSELRVEGFDNPWHQWFTKLQTTLSWSAGTEVVDQGCILPRSQSQGTRCRLFILPATRTTITFSNNMLPFLPTFRSDQSAWLSITRASLSRI
jgi:hypothetical protein